MRPFLALIVAILLSAPAVAGSIAPREGWAVHDTAKTHAALVDDLKAAVKAGGLIVVTQAGPTGAARQRGITIPGNMVLGVFNNDFAVRAIRLSVPAMIEAPIRFYVTEDDDGTATLSYKLPSHVFAPYYAEGGAELEALAAELDVLFAAIAGQAIE